MVKESKTYNSYYQPNDVTSISVCGFHRTFFPSMGSEAHLEFGITLAEEY